MVRPMAPSDKPAVINLIKTTGMFTPAEIEVAEELIDAYLLKHDVHQILALHQGGVFPGLAQVEQGMQGTVDGRFRNPIQQGQLFFQRADLLPIFVFFAFIEPMLEVLPDHAQHAADLFAFGLRICLLPLRIDHLAYNRLPILWQVDRPD